jgi:hypothetical protein
MEVRGKRQTEREKKKKILQDRRKSLDIENMSQDKLKCNTTTILYYYNNVYYTILLDPNLALSVQRQGPGAVVVAAAAGGGEV